MAEGDKDILVSPGVMVEMDAEVICRIIVQHCHCSVGDAARAANEIGEYFVRVMVASGSAEDVSNQTGEVQ
jgi:hypothetical protein